MNKYTVTITETLKRDIEIEAETVEEAINAACAKYDSGAVILDSSHYDDTKFEVKLC